MPTTGNGTPNTEVQIDTNNGYFYWLNWPNIRWFLAEYVLATTFLLIGALTNASGGYKAIPIILALLPSALVAILPVFVLYTLYFISSVSGFTVFWSIYYDSLTPYCYKIVDFFYHLLTLQWSKLWSSLFGDLETTASHSRNSKKAEIHDLEKEKKKNLKFATAEKESCNRFHKVIRSLNDHIARGSRKYNAEKYDANCTRLDEIQSLIDLNYTAEPESIQTLNDLRKVKRGDIAAIPVTPIEESTWSSTLYEVFKILIKFLAFIFIIVGSFVVIGMGILTNQGLINFFQIAPGTIATGFCVIASFMKQATQLAFGGTKQFDTICGIFRVFGIVIPNEDDMKIESLESKIITYKARTKKYNILTIELQTLHDEILREISSIIASSEPHSHPDGGTVEVRFDYPGTPAESIAPTVPQRPEGGVHFAFIRAGGHLPSLQTAHESTDTSNPIPTSTSTPIATV